MMKITKKQRAELWGETGPYSEVKLTVQNRILDDEVSRVFIEVSVHINPLTFKIISRNKKEFKNDPQVTALIEGAEYQGFKEGYVSCAFLREYFEEEVMDEAKAIFKEITEITKKIHRFVMDFLEG